MQHVRLCDNTLNYNTHRYTHTHRLLLELGYHLVPDTQSQAVSAINFDLPVEEPPTEEDKEDSVTLTQEQMAEFTLKHAEEMKKLQSEYE